MTTAFSGKEIKGLDVLSWRGMLWTGPRSEVIYVHGISEDGGNADSSSVGVLRGHILITCITC